MVSTIDGKIITGDRDQSVHDLGSAVDHATMKQVQGQAQAVIIGAGTLRATPALNYSPRLMRFVVSKSGAVDGTHSFFTQFPDQTFVVCPIETCQRLPEDLQSISFGEGEIDWDKTLEWMKRDCGIDFLLVEGGGELNAALFSLDLIDEIFLTFAPKIKLGRDVPTLGEGLPLPRGSVQRYDLISCIPVESEIFLRYRREGRSVG
jgi:riboflavin biosynthesis pyrimidine reductase